RKRVPTASPRRAETPSGNSPYTGSLLARYPLLFRITARNGVSHSAAIISADVGTPKRNAPSPVTAITRRSGRASLTPRDPPSAQPSPGPLGPVRVPGRVRSSPSYTAGAF